MKYITPKITTKKLHISFFLTQTNLTDSMGFLFGNVAQAQSGNCDPNNNLAECANCNNGTCSLGTVDSTSSASYEAQADNSGNAGNDGGGGPDGGPDPGNQDNSNCDCSSDGSQCSCTDCSCTS